uniref:Uncharacterized protein n=1 Tax=Spironucleus salmonicida TaxID=348837 RepID=V6M4L4_9EUKA|eukprot:EST48279.1 Hypothetical protein SS50377_11620 [Spironucleus salmonicida]
MQHVCMNVFLQDQVYGEKHQVGPPLVSEGLLKLKARENANFDPAMEFSGMDLSHMDRYIESALAPFDEGYAHDYFGTRVRNPIFVQPAPLLASYIDMLCTIIENERLEQIRVAQERRAMEEAERVRTLAETKAAEELERQRIAAEAAAAASKLTPEQEREQALTSRKQEAYERRKAEAERLDHQVQKSLEDKQRQLELEKELLQMKLALKKERNLKFQQQQIQFSINTKGYIYQSFYNDVQRSDAPAVEVRLPRKAHIQPASLIVEVMEPEMKLVQKQAPIQPLPKAGTLAQIRKAGRSRILQPATSFVAIPVGQSPQTRRCVSSIEQIRALSPYGMKSRPRVGVM